MALMTCPDCSHQMSDTAPACPQCGWARAAVAANLATAQHAAAKAKSDEEGAKLVRISTLVMAIGLLLMLSGCGLTIGLGAGPLPAIAGVGLGFIALVVSAVIGQVGRAKQGRIV